MNDTTTQSSIPRPRPAEAEDPPPATVAALRVAFAALGELPEEALDDEGLLQTAAEWERIRARADAGQLAVLAAFAARRSGRDREFADDEVALALRLTRWTAAGRTELAEALAQRLPATFAALRDGRIDQIRARAVADATLNLSDEAARAVEEAVLPKAERQNSAEVRRRARRAAVKADPAAAEKRRRKSEQDRHVAVVPREDAMADLSIFGAAEEVIAAYEQVDRLARAARADGDERTLDQLRADIALDLLAGRRAPQARGPAAVQVVVPVTTLLGLSEEPGELAGYGPIPAGVARQIAADATWRRLLTDPASGALLDYGQSCRRWTSWDGASKCPLRSGEDTDAVCGQPPVGWRKQANTKQTRDFVLRAAQLDRQARLGVPVRHAISPSHNPPDAWPKACPFRLNPASRHNRVREREI
jgi:hypothetical protein